MSARPIVGVYTNVTTSSGSTRLPAVFTSPIRSDIVQEVHTSMNKNKRQPYAVSKFAGHQSSAESWGTGRAVSRIPRVPGGGTHRAGQGAFGNMCRGGRMFAPTKIWRKWHRRINNNQKRLAVCSALAASALPGLVMARGHRISQIPEVPLVIDNKSVESLDKTRKAVALLKAIGAYEDIERVLASQKIRAGKGKYRNRRYVQRRGPLVVYAEKGPLIKSFRNVPGIEMCNVSALNLLQLAPGGHVGRFIIWTRDAIQKLDSIFGTYRAGSAIKEGFSLQHPILTNADVNRVINSDEIQSQIRKKKPSYLARRRRNALKNHDFMQRLNPYARVVKRRELVSQQRSKSAKAALVEAKRKGIKPEAKKAAETKKPETKKPEAKKTTAAAPKKQ